MEQRLANWSEQSVSAPLAVAGLTATIKRTCGSECGRGCGSDAGGSGKVSDSVKE
jgi:hypothetical protein